MFNEIINNHSIKQCISLLLAFTRSRRITPFVAVATTSFLDAHQIISQLLALVVEVTLQPLQVICVCLFLLLIIVGIIAERVEA